MKDIAHLLDVIDKVRDNVALGLMSDPGLSKTSQVKQWAERNGRRYCELIISQRMPSEISGMPMPVNETRRMEVFDFETLLELKDGDVLAFDEFTNGNIQTLNACLTLIQERTMLSGKKLPSLLIVAMGNPQGKCDLLPQTKQRFLWFTVKWDAETWKTYMRETWGFTPHVKLINLITNQYQDGFGSQTSYNYLTPRTIENLFRIALTIPVDDPFWNTLNVRSEVVEALYLSFKSNERFRSIKTHLIDWLEHAPTDDSVPTDIITMIKECQTMAHLQTLVESFESENLAPGFISYLKSETESGETDA